LGRAQSIGGNEICEAVKMWSTRGAPIDARSPGTRADR
jgi:hypothetical protein